MNVKKKKYDPDVWAPPTPKGNEKESAMSNTNNGSTAGLSKFQQRFKNKAVVVSKDGVGAQLPSVQAEAAQRSSVPHSSNTSTSTTDAKAQRPLVEADQSVLPPAKKKVAAREQGSSPPAKEVNLPDGASLKKNRKKVTPLEEPEIEAVQLVDAAAARGRQGSQAADLHLLASSPLRAPVAYIPPLPTEAAAPAGKPSKLTPQKEPKRGAPSPEASVPPPPALEATAGAAVGPKQVGSAGTKRAPSTNPPQRKSAHAKTNKAVAGGEGEEKQQQQQPNYTPYTLEDYNQLVNEVPLPKSGGLGPNDTDAQREAAERKKRQMQYGLKASRLARETLQQEIEQQHKKAEEKRRSSAAEETHIYQEKNSGQDDDDETEGEEEEDGSTDDRRTSEAFAPTSTSGGSSDRARSSEAKHRPSDHAGKKCFSVFGQQKTKQSIAAQARRQKALEYARQVAPAPAPAQRRSSSSAASPTRLTPNGLGPVDREAERREQQRLDLEAKHDRNKAAVDLIRKQLGL